MARKSDAEEGVPVSVKETPDRYEAGVPVSLPSDVSEKSGSKSAAKSATAKKES